ncbi:two component transcriptional regulator, LytTR family [Cyclobacterium lianum]|uniref:Two component transcriptional regulator, LytTR family n=1 Tax=Cyclobacterium lianum TaxID=388280 RepID=A0A1M7NIR3_9BACT|nr:LytTR family transcriptional regulator DNA-binding domain-containing protein [Cyclobacterium lianum]SHN03723.1 two component transcriptional regulator, LytTR family [Cyclobacterium lianum]
MIRCLIIDDEPLAQELLKEYLEEFPDFQVIGSCNDGFEAFKSINELAPDLLFLDIQMPKINGFELLDLLDQAPRVIFTTAYEAYALRAFDKQALDYLLKPFSRERLKQALDKVMKEFQENRVNSYKSPPMGGEMPVRERLERLVVKTGSKIHIIPVEKVTYLAADGDYVKIVSAGNSYLKLNTMTDLEHALDPSRFVRIHRSYLVNILEISKIEPYQKENHLVFLRDGSQLPVSKSGMAKLRKALRI